MPGERLRIVQSGSGSLALVPPVPTALVTKASYRGMSTDIHGAAAARTGTENRIRARGDGKYRK